LVNEEREEKNLDKIDPDTPPKKKPTKQIYKQIFT